MVDKRLRSLLFERVRVAGFGRKNLDFWLVLPNAVEVLDRADVAGASFCDEEVVGGVGFVTECGAFVHVVFEKGCCLVLFQFSNQRKV
jgi:hypothetical protein